MGINVGELNEGVSIIGVGATPFGDVMSTPVMQGMTERELVSWAAIEAMEDAGIESKDIDAFYLGMVLDETLSRTLGGSGAFSDWLGMRNKPGFHHEIACATSLAGLRHAVLSVASGIHRIVITANVETTLSRPCENMPAHIRERLPEGELFEKAFYTADAAYWHPSGSSLGMLFDSNAISYGKKYGLTLEQLDDVMIECAINNRHNALMNPLATMVSKEYSEEAKERGFDDPRKYLKSRFNPRFGSVARMAFASIPVDGASAVIVCPTKLAKKLVSQPIEVIGLGSTAESFIHESNASPQNFDQEAFRQAYQMARINDPYREIQYTSIHDCTICHQFISSEGAGYFRPGEAYQAILDGRTRIDGDKPMNSSGGRTAVGHAFAASGGAEIAETVRQMRGECGKRQVKNIPETSVVHTLGGGAHTCVTVLRKSM